MEKVTIKGVVGSGKALGRKLGFPTANIYDVDHVTTRDGVYAVMARVTGAEQPMPGVANLGHRPTVENHGKQRVLEVHFFNYEGDLYGCEIEVELCCFLRPEMHFDGVGALEEQIRKDETAARTFFDL